MAQRTRRPRASLDALAIALRRDSPLRRGLWATLFVLVAVALFASVALPREVALRAGEVASVTIKAPKDMVDRPTTDAARASAAAAVAPIYATDVSATNDALAKYNAGVKAINTARAGLATALAAESSSAASSASTSSSTAASASAPSSVPTQEQAIEAAIATLRQSLGVPVTDADYRAVLTADAAVIDGISATAYQHLKAALDAGVQEGQVASDQAALEAYVEALPYAAGINDTFAVLAEQSLAANDFIDTAETQQAQDAASSQVVATVISKGQVIVREGDRVTQQDIQRLQDAGLLRPGGVWGVLAGSAGVGVLLLGLCWAFLAHFYRRALTDEAQLVLFGSVLLGALGGTRLGLALSPFLVPLPWAAMLAAMAFGPGVALFVGGIGGLAAGLLTHDLSVAVMAITATWTGVFALRRLSQRSDLLRAGLLAGLAGAAATLVVTGLFLGQGQTGGEAVLAQAPPLHVLLEDGGAAAFAGLLSGVLAIGTLPFAEFLGVLTPFKLLELANPGQSLLRRLMAEAPGTYHHSLMVANLSEAACQAVGGDALLVRTAAYYHDIGKMKRPAFFVENQFGGENPHDKLSPQLSAVVITSHVKDGVEMARQAKLPRELIEFIQTHHGTTLVRYFYNAARQASERSEAEVAAGTAAERPGRGPVAILERDFRYDGPVPESRETAILMLADGVEAAVRSLPHPTPADIEGMIRRIIDDRLQDGQLDHASLTLADIDTIGATFLRLLTGAYHARIEYPETVAAMRAAAPPAAAALPVPARRPGGTDLTG